jgi:hypothetical protein
MLTRKTHTFLCAKDQLEKKTHMDKSNLKNTVTRKTHPFLCAKYQQFQPIYQCMQEVAMKLPTILWKNNPPP